MFLVNYDVIFIKVNEVEEVENDSNEMEGYGILDVLNPDCLSHIMSYVPLRDLIRSERVSKRWQMMVQEFIVGESFFIFSF